MTFREIQDRVLEELGYDISSVSSIPRERVKRRINDWLRKLLTRPNFTRPLPEPIQVDLPRESVQAAIANLPDLLNSALAVPRYRDDEGGQRVIDGFLVTQVKPSGTAERLGLRSGDVILDVNGQVLDGMPTVMRLFGQLQAAPKVTVTVLRDGRRMSVVFNTR